MSNRVELWGRVEKWRIRTKNGEKWEFELFHVEHVEF